MPESILLTFYVQQGQPGFVEVGLVEQCQADFGRWHTTCVNMPEQDFLEFVGLLDEFIVDIQSMTPTAVFYGLEDGPILLLYSWHTHTYTYRPGLKGILLSDVPTEDVPLTIYQLQQALHDYIEKNELVRDVPLEMT